MKGDYPMNFFKNVYAADIYAVKNAERYANWFLNNSLFICPGRGPRLPIEWKENIIMNIFKSAASACSRCADFCIEKAAELYFH